MAPPSWRDPILWAILAGSLALNTHRIDHAGLHYFDESFHAIVARNLLKHPLRPTLIDVPYLAFDPTEWGETHVWLHKPILPLWTIAASYAAFGVNTFALRLPSAVLAAASVGLTYLIGRWLFDRSTGLIAAAIQGINPAITMLLQGYLFSDHVDISLLFWVEVGVYFIVRASETGRWSDVLLVGVAQGLAFLSKSYLAGLLTGLAITCWLLPRIGLVGVDESKWKSRHLLGMVGVTLATVAPWMIYCAWAFPVEFAHEHGYVFTHLGQGVENWGGPWDRLYFDHLVGLNHAFYTPLIAAVLALLPSTVASRRLSYWFVYAWLFGVLAPHTVAATKTPSATLIALPAGFLLLARLMVEGWQGRGRSLAIWASIMVVVAATPSRIGRFSRGFPEPRAFGGVMMKAIWVFEHLAIALAIVGVMEVVRYWSSRRSSRTRSHAPCRPLARRHRNEEDAGASGTAFPRKTVGTSSSWERVRQPRLVLRTIALTATLMVGFRVATATWGVTEGSEARPFVTEMAGFARANLPENAVFLFDGGGKGDHQTAMFLLDRTCYLLNGRPIETLARQIQDAGGIPYVVTDHPDHHWPRRFAGSGDPRGLYEWSGPVISGKIGNSIR